MSKILRAAGAALLAVLASVPLAPVHAEGTLRIAEQYGISYLPLYVLRDQHLVEKYGRQAGIDIEVSFMQVGGGAASNDLLLSGSADVVAAGFGPLLTIWDRTRGEVAGIAAISAVPTTLLTNNPNVRTIADFTAADKIALPSAVVSIQARTLQYAAAQAFGAENWAQLDGITVSLPHPDATQALLARNGTITAHFSTPPFQDLALKDPAIHKVLDSFEVFGGTTTNNVLYATNTWREANPKTYAALLAGLDEAARFIKENPEAAVDTYQRIAGAKIDRDIVLSVITDPKNNFDLVPLNTEKLAHFLADVGAIRSRPETWRDYFFAELHDRAGS